MLATKGCASCATREKSAARTLVREAVKFSARNALATASPTMHDPALAERLITRRIVLENCPTSNLCTGALAKQIGKPEAALEDHPLPAIHQARLARHALHRRPGSVSHRPAHRIFASSLVHRSHQRLQLVEQSSPSISYPSSTNLPPDFRDEQKYRFPIFAPPQNFPGRHWYNRAMKAHVWVMLKSTVLDPQGQTIQRALSCLSYAKVKDVRQGKFFVLPARWPQPRGSQNPGGKNRQRRPHQPIMEEFRFEILD